jgi:hypothetical protein
MGSNLRFVLLSRLSQKRRFMERSEFAVYLVRLIVGFDVSAFRQKLDLSFGGTR